MARPLKENTVILRLHWQYHVKRDGQRRARQCFNGSKQAAPILYALAKTILLVSNILSNINSVHLQLSRISVCLVEMLKMSLLTLRLLKFLHSRWSIINIMNGTCIDFGRSLTSQECSLSFEHYKNIQNLASFGNNTSTTFWWVLLSTSTSNTLHMIVPFTKLHSKVIKFYYFEWLMIC